MKLLTNQKGVALITVMIAVVVVTMLSMTIMMMLINELKGNSKVIELAEARYKVEGLIEENIAFIHQQLDIWINDPIIQTKATPDDDSKSIDVQNQDNCYFNETIDPVTVLFKYAINSDDEYDLKSINFPESSNKVAITCSNGNHSIKATVQFLYNFDTYQISEFGFTELVRQ